MSFNMEGLLYSQESRLVEDISTSVIPVRKYIVDESELLPAQIVMNAGVKGVITRKS